LTKNIEINNLGSFKEGNNVSTEEEIMPYIFERLKYVSKVTTIDY